MEPTTSFSNRTAIFLEDVRIRFTTKTMRLFITCNIFPYSFDFSIRAILIHQDHPASKVETWEADGQPKKNISSYYTFYSKNAPLQMYKVLKYLFK